MSLKVRDRGQRERPNAHHQQDESGRWRRLRVRGRRGQVLHRGVRKRCGVLIAFALSVLSESVKNDAQHIQPLSAYLWSPEPPVTITKLMDDYHVVVGERVEFEIEVSEEGAHVMWSVNPSFSDWLFKTQMQKKKKSPAWKRMWHWNPLTRFFEDVELHKDSKDSKYRFKKDGKKHTLIIQEATLDDIGMYHAWTNGGHTKGELEVEGTTGKHSVSEETRGCIFMCAINQMGWSAFRWFCPKRI